MAVTQEADRDQRLAVRGGAMAGLLSGVVLELYGLAMAALSGRDGWAVLKGAAAPLLRARAMQPGFDAAAVLLGILCHLAVSVVWGVLFGLMAYGLSRGATFVAGLLWGLVVWIGMFYLVLPMVGLGQVPRSVPVGAAITQHLLFGAILALAFLPFQRSARRPLEPGFSRRSPQP